MLNYIDTIEIYTDSIKVDVSIGLWNQAYNKSGDSNLDNFYIRDGHINLRYFPDLWGVTRLKASFSIPKLINGNNIFPTSLSDAHVAVSKLWGTLNRHIGYASIALNDLYDWEVSRMDLFVMHRIQLGTQREHLDTYKNIYLGNYHKHQHGSTSYWLSGKYNYNKKNKNRQSSVIRIYPKAKEIAFRQGLIDEIMEDDFEWHLCVEDIPLDCLRIEFQMKRPKLKALYKSKSVTLRDALDYSIQIGCINRYLQRMKLNIPILRRKALIQLANVIFKKADSRKRAMYLTDAIHDGHKPQLTSRDAYIMRRLRENGAHIVTSRTLDLPPVPLL